VLRAKILAPLTVAYPQENRSGVQLVKATSAGVGSSPAPAASPSSKDPRFALSYRIIGLLAKAYELVAQ
jgi:hypothetical protein